MFKETWKEYVRGYKFLLPFVLVLMLFERIMGDLKFDQVDIFGGIFSIIKELLVNNLRLIIITLFLGSLFYAFLMLVMKTLINEGEANYRKSFIESLGLYVSFLGLNIITSAILMSMSLLAFIPIVSPIAMILLMLINVLLIPCKAYLIYHRTNLSEALKKGILVGKKYFSEMVLFSIAIGIAVVVISGIMSAVNIDIKASPVGDIFINFVTTSISMYLYMYVVVICKKEEKIEGKILEY